LLTI
jgi:hypothetical protein